MKDKNTSERGFTLIEVIIAITLVAIVATFLYSAFGGRPYSASMGVGGNLSQSQGLQKAMENIISDFKENYTADLIGLQTLQGKINSNPSYGTYSVVENVFGDFVNNVWVNGGGSNNRLKVTIQNTLGETLTIVFSTQQ